MQLSDFGISRLSPSSLSSWASSPALWCLRYLFGFKDTAGPAAVRGSAVESALKTYLYHPDTDPDSLVKIAEDEFEVNLQGEIGNHIESERKLLRPMVETAIRGAKERNVNNILATQLRVSAFLPGVDVEVVGYIDFSWGNGQMLELKTTKRMPSYPRDSHLRQGAFYRYARGMSPLELFYVSDKRVVFHDVTDAQVSIEISGMAEDAKSLIKCLKAFKTPADMLSALPMSSPFKISHDAMQYRKKVLSYE